MKLKVILVDDEPSAIRALQFILDKYFPNFEVADCAKNGLEALEKIKKIQPDILITDIRMPLLNGIDLVEAVQKECPSTHSVIMSGYQDFEYAKSAIRLGVADYLLKPLDLEQLKRVLEKLRLKKIEEIYEMQISIISNYIQNANPKHLNPRDIERYLPYESFMAALVRINGIPSRFSTVDSPVWIEIYRGKDKFVDPVRHQGIWAIEGRDFLEFFVLKAQKIKTPSINEIIQSVLSCCTYKYYTAVIVDESFRLAECYDISRMLYQTLDNNVVLGLNQTIYFSKNQPSIVSYSSSLTSSFIKRVVFLVLNGMYEDLKVEIKKIFQDWKRDKRPLLWIENDTRQLIDIILRRICYTKTEDQPDVVFLLDKAFAGSTTFDELFTHIWSIIDKITSCHRDIDFKMDTKDFFKQIEMYVQQNLGEPLSLDSVCAHIGISQAYLSKLFRKYTNMSFNKYVTMHRIEEAKKLMRTIPNITVQDVASAVGYEIPSYFSKVFREIVGMTPSEYIANKNSIYK